MTSLKMSYDEYINIINALVDKLNMAFKCKCDEVWYEEYFLEEPSINYDVELDKYNDDF